ncbi:unnamed protein product [Clonostachys chloroleuca]|uniref:Uncharacterized protein n=1 Tax=Clonostachys chloroleuca TaxID=1926264 RepID=A0AA35MCG9_9HYPO|nr:unnamed protein product [Clonostachys chloroleuca]
MCLLNLTVKSLRNPPQVPLADLNQVQIDSSPLPTRIRLGIQDQSDVDLLNTRCYQEGRQIPWETGITVVMPLNRNRWNLNMEATLAFQQQHKATLRIFISDYKWKDGQPTEEEALMILNHGDDSAIPVPAVFLFLPGMPVVVNCSPALQPYRCLAQTSSLHRWKQ